MLSKHIKKGILFSAIILMATAGIALAHGGGYGYGGSMMGYGSGNGGYGYGMMGPGMMGYGPGNGGYGYGMMGPGTMGYGNYGGPMTGNGPGANRNFNNNLSDQQIAKLETARKAFFNDTRDLRNQIQDKEYSLRSELDKQTRDTAKVTQLRKELSKLQGEYNQKNIEFQLKLRKILPDNGNGTGFGPGYGDGYR